jgi:acetylornithine deacetylase/succinyl-diaminopimelate desuccinylase-like protein
LLKAARELVAADTVSGGGTREILPLLCEFLQGVGLVLDFQSTMIGGCENTNLVASAGPHAPGGLLLASHVDTVDPGEHSKWVRCGGDPWKAVVHENVMYGLGTASGKLDWLAKAEAVRRVLSSGRRLMKPLHLVATYGEQMGLLGAKQLTEAMAAIPEFAVVGEPTGLSVMYANKGYVAMRFRLRFIRNRGSAAGKSLSRVRCFGTPAHSAVPTMGDSAVDRALSILVQPDGRVIEGVDIVSMHGGDAVNRVPDFCEADILGFSEKLKWLDGEKANIETVTRVMSGAGINQLVEAMVLIRRSLDAFVGSLAPKFDRAFDPPGPVHNLGMVRSTPEHLEFTLDLRLLPGQDFLKVRNWLAAVTAQSGRAYPDVDVEAAITTHADPMRTSREGKLVTLALEIARRAGIESRASTKSVTTEGSVYSAKGIETIAFGPGSMVGVVHLPDEHVALDELGKAVDFYERLAAAVCTCS